MAKEFKFKETFQLFDPQASSVTLVGDFTGWEKRPIALNKQKDGTWTTTVPLDPGVHEYRFIVDGQWRDDDRCSLRKPNPFGATNCLREVKQA